MQLHAVSLAGCRLGQGRHLIQPLAEAGGGDEAPVSSLLHLEVRELLRSLGKPQGQSERCSQTASLRLKLFSLQCGISMPPTATYGPTQGKPTVCSGRGMGPARSSSTTGAARRRGGCSASTSVCGAETRMPSRGVGGARAPSSVRAPVSRDELLRQASVLKLAAKNRIGNMKGKRSPGLRVLSVFDGIGCVAYAMRKLGIPIEQYIGCDTDSDGMNALGVARVLNGEAVQGTDAELPPHDGRVQAEAMEGGFGGITRIGVSDADKITEEVIKQMGRIDLVVGGPPCKDLSKLRMMPDRQGRRGTPGPGLAGPTGRLFKVMVDIIRMVLKHNPDANYMLENVVFDHLQDDWAQAKEWLGEPTIMDCRKLSYTRRTRAFWHNIDLPEGWDRPSRKGGRDQTDMLDEGWEPSQESATITASWKGDPQQPVQDTSWPFMVHRIGDPAVKRCLRVHEAECLMGMEEGATEDASVTPIQRLHGIGNGMDINCLMHLLEHVRWGPRQAGETRIGSLTKRPWVHGLTEGMGTQPLDVERIAPWLTAGPCPVGRDDLVHNWQQDWCHTKAEYLIKELGEGMNIRYEGPRGEEVVCENNPSWREWPEEAAKIVNKEVESGRWAGPFIAPPVEGLKQTPMAMVEEPDKFRHITNAKMGPEINKDIPDPEDAVHMPTHTELKRRLRVLAGKGTTRGLWMAKRDIRRAYRNLLVRLEDWAVSGVRVDGAFYLDTALNFGTRSSPDKFLEVADAIEWALRRWGVECTHYIDDFVFMGSSKEEVDEMIARFEIVCAEFGLPIKEEKDVGPAQVLTVLGVEYDLLQGTVRMPQRQLTRIQNGCEAILKEGLGTKEARSLLGVVSWASQCLERTEAFTSRLWNAVETADAIGARNIKVSHGLRDDMRWWLAALSAGMGQDGTAIIKKDKEVMEKGAGDAGSEWGIGGHDSTYYYKAALTTEVKQAAHRKAAMSSKFLELWQLLVMARVMGPGWKGKHVCIQVDNQALVPMFKKGRAKKPRENDMYGKYAFCR